MIHSTDLMLSPTVIVFFAKILQNLLKITFPPPKICFFPETPHSSQLSESGCALRCLEYMLFGMLVNDLYATWDSLQHIYLSSHSATQRPSRHLYFFYSLPCLAQHMPSCETWSLNGIVFQLRPEISFDTSYCLLHASDFAFIIFFLDWKQKC